MWPNMKVKCIINNTKPLGAPAYKEDNGCVRTEMEKCIHLYLYFLNV